ncbi:alpha/beta fold hydrolase [Paenibacillus polymyxa]|uniref:alpha/beta fold hydrolase n=1 Tax=Paenibacillus polymyxa TaxID=1406 RepID=UPI0025B67E36|nr:alpha/beta hydrolase [Paenibacillus polymyxa]MDN4083489.1 alpha/beta hydrolase [Paenibacillus polymyxa]MDN4089666.1 alpha/beta hydrolase [Paenibacillus polymyxa]MDN4110440.1 alpha/beta hydrolase [Paenibacillus polymyxa]
MTTTNIHEYFMHYIDSGEGTAILFIHPPVLTSSNFTYQIQGLSPYFRTIAFDIRGHGKSQPSEQTITYSLIAQDIKHLMDRLSLDKVFLCGYSTGGSIVLEFLLTYPDRAWGGIVVSGMSEVNEWRLRNKISLGIALSKIGAVGTIALSNAWSQTKQLSLFRKLFNDAKQGNPRNVEQYYRYSLKYNCTSRLGEIDLPVLLVYGEEDKHFHPYANILHQHLPKSELVFIKKADHRLPTKAAGSLNELIKQFIERFSL